MFNLNCSNFKIGFKKMAGLTPYTMFIAIILILSLIMLAKFAWMCIYQFRYGKDYGERYIKGLISKEEKEELKRRVNDRKN
jgi:hypothetical protein